MNDLQQIESYFNHLYGDINGYSVSTNARSKFDGDTTKMLYGELPFATFASILEELKPVEDGVFYDLGSGTGRVVLQAYMLGIFRKCKGIELLDGLHDKAVEVKEKFDLEIKPKLFDHISDRQMELVKDDLFKQDYSEVDFIFMNHPIKDSDLFMKLEQKLLEDLKPGTKICTIIRALKDPRFKNLGKKTLKFSWGDSTAHFFEV